jgi:UDP-GlcNAc3NAcA epimerase
LKIVTIVGARPQFIKAAAVSRVLRARPEVHDVLVHTGQHYDENMSAIFFSELEIPEADYNLGIGGGAHGVQTGRMLEAVEQVIIGEKPDWVLVYGDTNSTLAGSLAAAKLRVPVAHVEAGLRSFNRAMPEEINRVVADHLSDLLFAPTAVAVANLKNEGIPHNRVRLTGDVMYDAALFYAKKAQAATRIVETLGLAPGAYALATIHRAENTDNPTRLAAVFAALARLAGRLPVVLPLHPRTRNALADAMPGQRWPESLRVIDPVGYLDMTRLEASARLIVTDSGGVQKEAFFHGVPCATLRTETEWTELVHSGWNTLLDPTQGAMLADRLVAQLDARPPNARPNFYGEGDASERIAEALLTSSR